MKQIFFISLLVFLFTASSCRNETNTPTDNKPVQFPLKVDIDNVIDFTSDGENYYFLTEKEIIKVDSTGKILEKEGHKNLTGICYNPKSNSLLKITLDRIIINEKGDSIKINTSKIKESENSQTKFLAYDGENYYTCLSILGFNRNGGSYSDQIIIFKADSGMNLFYWYFGNPEGLSYYGNSINYLGSSIIRIMNVNPKKITLNQQIIPINNPIGIYKSKVDSFKTYSRELKEIMKFKEK